MSDAWLKRSFLAPTLILLIGLNIFPLIWSLYLSFHDYNATGSAAPVYVGTENFRNILNDPTTWRYFQTTATFVTCAVGLEFLLGFGLAMLFNRAFAGRGFWLTLALLPMMLSPAIVGLFWKFLLDPTWGFITHAISIVTRRSPPEWLTDPDNVMKALVLVDVWMWTPFMLLISLAGLAAVPKSLYEAASVDRASALFRFFRITLPMIAPLLLVALLFRTMDAFKLFDMVYTLTNGGPGDASETVSVSLYRLAFQQFDTGKACALAYIMLVIVIALSNLYVRMLVKIKGDL